MDVRCNRCGTEYEFDDALISERGTTVKCTNCGLQFKVYPKHHSGGPERWVVRTADDRELVFTSLRELQRGIAERKVGPGDMLTRGQKPPRPLGSIAELEPFFQSSLGKVAASASTERPVRTLHGVAPPPNSLPPSAMASTATSPFPYTTTDFDVPEPPAPSSPRPQAEAPLLDALSVTMPAVEAPPEALAARAALVEISSPPPSATVADVPQGSTLPAMEFSGALPTPAPVAVGAPRAAVTAPLTPEPTPLSTTLSLEDYERQRREAAALRSSPQSSGARIPLETMPRSSPNAARGPLDSQPRSQRGVDSTPRAPVSSRGSFHSYDELASPAADRAFDARRARSRWIVGLVAIGMVGLIGATVGRRYLAGATVPSPAAAPTSDKRVKDFLARGTQLADEGDYEAAQEELVKASALAEKDPRVLAALARLETMRADVFWLKLRLLDPSSTELVAATHRELGRRVGKARQAADRAFALAPDDPVVIRARVDSMRLSGESDKAREWIAPVSSNASQPENAFVLAALDLSDSSPVWASVLDRLRTAAAGEREPGRARAALIYALARADRVAEARTELLKLEAQPKPHVLLDELRAFLARFPATDSGKAPTPLGSAAVVDVSKLPKLDTSVAAEEKPSSAVPTDFRTALSQAAAAARSGDYGRAETLYNAALSSQPGNVEALSGLGDIARRRGDAAQAAQLYERVLSQNPSYLPALIASADLKWSSGNRAGALQLYRRVVDQVGPSSDYGARAQARINEANSAGAGSHSEKSEPAPTPTPAPTSEPPPDVPHIDTTDLPGMK
jgi:predicted Zn finger-like uncharacterized protein